MTPRILHYTDLENAYDTPTRIAQVAGCVAERRGPDALVAGSGDNTGPGVLSLVTEGRQSLAFFDAVRPHVDTVGNHDLDHGTAPLEAIVRESPQTWTLANVTDDGRPFGVTAGVKRRTSVTVDGATVGVVGVLDPATPEMTPGVAHLTFHPPVEAVAEHELALRHEGVDFVVALAHTADETTRAIARETRVDAVLAGHSHERTATVVDGTPVSRPGATGQLVHELDLATGEIRRHRTADARADNVVATALRDRLDVAGLTEVVAHVDDPLSRDRERRLAGEWRLGNFVADAYRWQTGADVALQNAGGVREGPPLAGDVTVGDLIGLSPFDEPVVVASVSGAELRSIVSEADGRTVDGLRDRWYGHVSGMRIENGPDGYEPYVDGDPVDPEARYTLATPDFLLRTEREFPTLTSEHRVESDDVQFEVIVAYARENGIAPELEGRLPDAVARD